MSDKEKIELLARKVIFALQYLDCRGSGMVLLDVNNPTATSLKTVHWTRDFAEALKDATGIEVDLEKLDEQRLPKRERERLARQRAKSEVPAAGKDGGGDFQRVENN